MKKNLKLVLVLVVLAIVTVFASGCEMSSTRTDVANTLNIGNALSERQPTPTDINYSLERYNLTRRTYWVNGQREKANVLVCGVEKPLGYIVLFSGNAVVGNFVVDGKVSSLNSYLTPDSKRYESDYENNWLPDVDGSYGENDSGIFFFTVDGKYIEWTGTYLYSDIPFIVDNPMVTYTEGASKND